MTTSRPRRSIDWRVTVADNPPRARLIEPTSGARQLAAITSRALAEPSPQTVDAVLRQTVKFALSVIGLQRAALYVLDEEQQAMMGTWGTDASGNIIDEHDIMYDYGELDREVVDRARQGFAWTAYDDCPHIAQEAERTRVIGRGWVACTPIIGPSGHLGTLFNDTAITHSPLNEAQQARAAVLCSLLGRALESCRSFLFTGEAAQAPRQHPLVREATRALAADPGLSCEAIAGELGVSTTTLTRTFKREVQMSVVDYRNELRLARFLENADAEGKNLLEAALAAGFGSNAQFYRVFRARFGRAPREYLLLRRQGKSSDGPKSRA